MKIGIVNDLPMAVEALRRALALAPRHEVIWTANDGAEAVALCARQRPDLVLMDFAGALARVSGLEGRRVHRSWWVARAAVVGVRRGDGRAMLTLAGGPSAPVSRRYATELRSAGWY